MLQHAFRAVVKPLMRSAKAFATASKFHVPTRRTLFTHQVNRRVLGSGSSPFSLDSTMFRTRTTDASGLANNGSQEKQNGTEDSKTQVARDALERAETALSEAEKKRDAAEEKWVARDEPHSGFYFNALNAAQAAVERAQETYDLHVRGLANGNGSSKLPADDPQVVAAQKWWNAELEWTTVDDDNNSNDTTTHKTGKPKFKPVYVLDPITGEKVAAPYDVLTVKAPWIFGDTGDNTKANETRFLVRDFYDHAFKTFVAPDVLQGDKFILIWRGPPGTGKSRGWGAGFMLFSLRELMKDEAYDFNRIVWTRDDQSRCYVFCGDGTVEIYKSRANAVDLASDPQTLWIQDGAAQNGFLDAARGVIIVASLKQDNYDEAQKSASRILDSPLFGDGIDQYSVNGVPVELEALRNIAFPHITDDELLANFLVFGGFPRAVLTDPSKGRALLQQALRSVYTRKLHPEGSVYDSDISARLLFSPVNRRTLKQIDEASAEYTSVYVAEQLKLVAEQQKRSGTRI